MHKECAPEFMTLADYVIPRKKRNIKREILAREARAEHHN